MKKIISLILGISFLFSLVGCNTKTKDKVFRASDDIKCTSSFYIRKGETIICSLPYSTMANNYQEFEEEILNQKMNVIIDDKKDELILSGYCPYLYVTCQEEFDKPIVIKYVKTKINENVYEIIPVEYTFYFIDEEYLEPPFAPSHTLHYGDVVQCNNISAFRVEGFSCFDNNGLFTTWFVMSPKRNGLTNALIEIQSIEPMPNSVPNLEKIEYCIFTDVENDFATYTSIEYDLMEGPIVINDKDYEIDECLVLKFTFSDTFANDPYVNGGTLKFKVKINGDEYSLYRTYNYYRWCNQERFGY